MITLTLNQKMAVIQKLTRGEGPIATAANAAFIGLSSEYDRHIQNTAWILDGFDDAFGKLVREVGEPLIHETIKELPLDAHDRFAPIGQREPIHILSVQLPLAPLRL